MPIRPIETVLAAIAEPDSRVQPVIERAAELGAALDARLILFHATFDSYLSGRPFFDSKRLARSRGWLVAERTSQLERHAASLRRRRLEADVRVVWEEPAHEAIMRAAIREDAGLVIAGPHGNREAGWAGLTFTDWELLRLCSRPLLLVRTHRASRGPPRGMVVLALDPMHANDKPATLDGALTAHGVQLATALGAELHAVHCVPRSAYPLQEITASVRKRMHSRRFAKLKRALQRSGAADTRIHILEGTPESTLPDFARQLSAQLLVLGAVSRRGLSRLAIGNTAERLIHRAPCDLLVVKPAGFKPKLGRTRKQAVILPPAKDVV